MNPFRLAVRRLVLLPGFSVAAIACLALGIGANSTVFAAVEGLLRRPLPFTDGDRIVWVFARPLTAAPAVREKLTTPEVSALARRSGSFSAVAVIGDRSLFVEAAGRHQQWSGLWVTPGIFQVLDITPAAGRALDVRDMLPSGPPALMLAHERWTQDFGSDPGVVGRVLSFSDNKRFTVVGILPKGLEFPLGRAPHSGNGSGFVAGAQDFWILGQERPHEYPGGTVIARMQANTSHRSAAAEAAAAAAALTPAAAGPDDRRTFEIVSLRDQLLGTLAPALPIAQAFAILVLIVAGANVTNLMMMRAIGLERDAAIRQALGGNARAVMLPLVAEGVLLCAAGSAAGIGLAWAILPMIQRALASQPGLAERIEFGGGVLVVAVALCGVTAVACVAAPIATRARLSTAALLGRSDSRQSSRGAGRWRRVLVVSQVALALLVLVGASLLYRSLSRLTSVDLGYERHQVVVADVMLYLPIREVQAFYEALMPRLRALPGVEAAGVIQSTPLTGKWTFTDSIVAEGGSSAAPVQVAGNFVGFGYFAAMQIPTLAGREFTEAELRLPRPPVILNDVAARLVFGAEHPVGRRVVLGGRPREVVGVVKGTRDVALERAASPQYYEPGLFGDSQLVIRTSGDPVRFVETLRAELLAADPRLIIRRVQPLDAIVAGLIFERRMISRLLVGFAFTALLLAIAGIYGVAQAGASQRRTELGVRAALGARPVDLLTLVLRQAVWLAACGIVTGVAASLLLGQAMRTLLFDTSATDAVSIAGAAGLLLVVSAASAFGPARRAARVDPVQALRSL